MSSLGKALVSAASLMFLASLAGILHDSHPPWEAYAFLLSVACFLASIQYI